MKSNLEKHDATCNRGEDRACDLCAVLESADSRAIGRWGRMHKAYLRDAHPTLYRELAAAGTLRQYLAETEERASALLCRLTEQMAKDEGVTESLKAKQPMVWVGRMNSIRNRAEEIVRNEIVNTL